MKKKNKSKSLEKDNEDECFPLQHYNNTESIINKRCEDKKNVGYKNVTTLSKDNNEYSDVQQVEYIEKRTKKKKDHKNKSSKKLHEDESFSNQHYLYSEFTTNELVPETKIKHIQTRTLDKDESLLLQFEHTDQPAKTKKKSHKHKSPSKKLYEYEGLSNQHCSNAATDQFVSESKRKRKHSKIFDAEESLSLEYESTDQSVKKKKSNKNRSSKKNSEGEGLPNQHCLNSEMAADKISETKRSCSNIFDADESIHLLYDQPAVIKKKSHGKKSHSKKLVQDIGFSKQHCLETETHQLKTEKKHKSSKVMNVDESSSLQYEATNQIVRKKKKSHKNKFSKEIHEDEGLLNKHFSNSETSHDLLVPETKTKHKYSKILDAEESPLLQFEPTDQPVCKKKKSHKNKSKKIHEGEGFSNQHRSTLETAPNHYNANNLTRCNSSRTIPESMDQDDCINSENEVLFDTIHFSLPDFDLTEEPVTFNVPLLHSSESAKVLSEKEKEYLNSNGVIIKTGRFSTVEDDILRRNYVNFNKCFGVNNPQLLLGLGRKQRNVEVTKFLKAKHFYVRLGEGLNNRSLRNIYRRARLLFDPSRKKGKFVDEEVTQLKKMHASVGKKWEEIGNIIDRSGNTTRSAFLWYDKHVKIGKWSLEERNNLIKAIEVVTGITDLSKIESDTIPWETVAELVPTRNFFQCRKYWLDDLSWTSKGNLWNKSHYTNLISILAKECYVEEYSDIDWKRVQKCFSDVTCISPSWVFLRKKLYSLKRYVPPELKINYKKMINFLSIKYGVDPTL